MAKHEKKLGYRAVTHEDKMVRLVPISSKSEDKELFPIQRRDLISQTRDSQRNYALCGFAVRKHLQSVGYYSFHVSTKDMDFNRRLSQRIKRWSLDCDVTGRHTLQGLLYLIEQLRVVDGDVGILRCNGGKIQLIESDRIQDPPDRGKDDRWIHGVRVNEAGKAEEYSIYSRTQTGLRYESRIMANDLDLLGYYTRYDQVRGVSPLAPAIRLFSQLESITDLTIAKLKLEAAIGIVSTLEGESMLSGDVLSSEERNASITNAVRDTFGPNLSHIGLHEGEEIKILESNNPSSNAQSYTDSIIRLVLSSLDIPYAFYDSSDSSWSSNRTAISQYLDSVEIKQSSTISLINKWLREWLLPLWIIEGSIKLPAGWTIDDALDGVTAVGSSLPLATMLEWAKDATLSISAGLISPIEFCESYGYDPRKNIDDMQSLLDYAKEKGISLPYGRTTSTNVGL